MRIVLSLLCLFSALNANAVEIIQTTTVAETLSQCQLTIPEMQKIYAPVGYISFGGSWPTKPAMNFRPRTFHNEFRIKEVICFFFKPNNWRTGSGNAFFCEGEANSGPQENKRIGKIKNFETNGERGIPVNLDFSGDNIVMDYNTSFYIVFGINNTDGSPWLTCERTGYKDSKNQTYKLSADSWANVQATPGWVRLSATYWNGSDFGDYAIWLVIEWLEVNNAEATTWKEIKASN